MPPFDFPLRWESTGDHWWYASPIDWAAANGHYDVVRELLHIDPNLLINLTSLRRIRRLETVWDGGDARFADVAACRASVARSLLLECESSRPGKPPKNSLIRGGYGGWLLYTAASAGDIGFVNELLHRDPLLVFGEGEFGVTDILYAAARSRSSQVFRLLVELLMAPRFVDGGGNGEVFRWEVLNRAVHAAARGGNLGALQELLGGCGDVLVYRDAHGSTVLHTASGRGQVEVVKNLIATYDIINSRDNKGNTSLHVAAFRGHLAVVKALVEASPSSIAFRNKVGDTFLHLAVAGFRTPGFRRLDRQMELMKQLISGKLVNIEQIVNSRNNDGRTILHMAVIGNVQCSLVALLMTIRSIDLNVRDVDGMTPLDLINQRPRSASSEILIKRLTYAGGKLNTRDYMKRSGVVSDLKMQGLGDSPGTTFKVSDAEIFLYTGIEIPDPCGDGGTGRPSSCSSISKDDLIPLGMTEVNMSPEKKRQSSVSNAANRLKTLVRWPRKKEKNLQGSSKTSGVEDSVKSSSLKKGSQQEVSSTPLRQRFSRPTSLPNNKRTLSVRASIPSPSTKKKFAAGLMHGVIQAMPHLATPGKSPRSHSSMRSISSPGKSHFSSEIETAEPSLKSTTTIRKFSGNATTSEKRCSGNTKLMNHYFCFGAQGLAVEENATSEQRSKGFFKRAVLAVN